MPRKQMPTLSPGHWGARAGRRNEDSDQAFATFCKKHHGTDLDKSLFQRGYLIGQIHDRLDYVKAQIQYRDDLPGDLETIDHLAQAWGYAPDERDE